MAWKLDSQKLLKPGPALVTKFAEMEKCPGNRHVKGWRLKGIVNALKEGKFEGSVWASVYCKETGKLYQLNGQHTSLAMHSLNGEMAHPTFRQDVRHYICDTLADVADLYRTFDPSESARSTGDINKAVACTIPGLEDKPLAVISIAVSAIDCAINVANGIESFKAKRSLPYDRAERLRDNVEFVGWLHALLGNSKAPSTRHLWRAVAVAVMYQNWSHYPRLATEFWTAVRDGEGEKGGPTRVLEHYLRENALRQGNSDNREMYAKCVHGWNAWKRKEVTALRYMANKPLPTPV